MNKSLTFTLIISSLVLANCSKIKDYRNDPSEWGQKKVKRSQTIENSPFTTKLKSGPTRPNVQPFVSTPTAPVIQPIPEIVAPTRIDPITQSRPQNVPPLRVSRDLIEPDISGLPNSADLQESDNIAPPLTPLPEPIPIIRRDLDPVVPSLAPLLDDPNDGLIPPP